MNIGSSGTPPARWGDNDRARHTIAAELARHGEPPATHDELLRLQHEGLLDAAEQGELSYKELANTIRGWRRTSRREDASRRIPERVSDGAKGSPVSAPRMRPPLMIPMEGPLPDDLTLARQYAVSRVLAASLAEDLIIWERIARFRQEHLGGSLLAWEDVGQWIAKHRAKASDRAPSFMLSDVPISWEQIERGQATAPSGFTNLEIKLTVHMPSRQGSYDDGERDKISGIGKLEPRSERMFLKFLMPGQENEARERVVAEDELDAVRRLSEDLAPADPDNPWSGMDTMRPWWSRGQATTFILTGLAPFVTTFGAMWLRIDPVLPLDQVMEQVAQARRAKVGERAREMSAKHLHLAVFGAERPEEPWSERLDAWNKTYPDWAYPETRRSNFIRDSVVAKRRLLLQERQRQESDTDADE